MTESRPWYVTQWEYNWVKEVFARQHPQQDVDEFMKNFETFTPISEQFKDLERETRLGSLKNEQQPRVEEDSKVSGVRNLGVSISAVYLDEAYYPPETGSVCTRQATSCGDASQWLEHRMFCRRDVLACLSGEAV